MLCGVVGVLRAQTTEEDVKARLMGKPLYLRGFWTADNLKFDGAGMLLSKPSARMVTLSGFAVTDVMIDGSDLVLVGYRAALVAKSDPGRGLERKTIAAWTPQSNAGSAEKMTIVIEGDADHHFDLALDRIFSEGLADLAPSVPASWKCYAASYFIEGDVAPDADSQVHRCVLHPMGNEQPPFLVGGSVAAPRVVSSKKPRLPAAAQELSIHGAPLVNLTINKDGSPMRPQMVRAVGAGMDDEALAAVSQYRFEPVPAPEAMDVEVSFSTQP